MEQITAYEYAVKQEWKLLRAASERLKDQGDFHRMVSRNPSDRLEGLFLICDIQLLYFPSRRFLLSPNDELLVTEHSLFDILEMVHPRARQTARDIFLHQDNPVVSKNQLMRVIHPPNGQIRFESLGMVTPGDPDDCAELIPEGKILRAFDPHVLSHTFSAFLLPTF